MHRAVRVKQVQYYLILMSFDYGTDKVYKGYFLIDDKVFAV